MTDKISLNNLGSFDPAIITTVNTNNAKVTAAINNTLSRDGTFPNQMTAPLDMNSQHILNLPAPINAVEPLRLQELINFTGGTGIVGPPGPPGAPGDSTFATKAAAQVAIIPSATLFLRIAGYNAAGDGGAALYKKVGAQPTHQGRIQSADGAWWELSENIINPVMFGADPTGIADSAAAFQNAYDYNVNGVDIHVNPSHTFKISTPVILTHPGSITCERAFTANRFLITAGTSSNDVFQVRSGSVTLRGLTINRPGNPTGSSIAISIGDDTRVVTDGAMTNGSSTFTSATAAFTSADIGKFLVCSSAGLVGPSFPITSLIGPTQVSVAPKTATATVSSAATQIGNVYADVIVQDCWLINHNIGLFVGSSQRGSFRNNRIYALIGIQQNVKIWGDLGDHEYIGGTYQSTDDATGKAFQILSGGGGKLVGCKILGGFVALDINWNGPSSSLGPFISGCSIEGGSNKGISINCSTNVLDGIIINGCEIGVNGTQVFVDNASAFQLAHCAFTGNLTRAGGGNTHFSMGNIARSTFAGNTCAGGGLGTAYVMGTASANNVIDAGVNDTTTAVANSGTGNVIK